LFALFSGFYFGFFCVFAVLGTFYRANPQLAWQSFAVIAQAFIQFGICIVAGVIGAVLLATVNNYTVSFIVLAAGLFMHAQTGFIFLKPSLEQRNYIKFRNAQKAKDPEICAHIVGDPFKKDKCYFDVAVKTRDRSLCRNINNSSDQEICVTGIKGDIEACRNMQDYLSRDKCLNTVALVMGNEAICQEIETLGFQQSCYVDLAAMKNDLNICNGFYDAGTIEWCRNRVKDILAGKD
jgi:hypothetical protein